MGRLLTTRIPACALPNVQAAKSKPTIVSVLGAEKNVRAGVFTYGGLDTENCGPVIDYRDVTKGTDPRSN